jgi:hypothetical protein
VETLDRTCPLSQVDQRHNLQMHVSREANLGLNDNNMRGRNQTESERSSIEKDNAFLLAMGDGALPNPYPEENLHL